jgi:hypothetical protein
LCEATTKDDDTLYGIWNVGQIEKIFSSSALTLSVKAHWGLISTFAPIGVLDLD